MKKDEVIYFSDELNDDFGSANLKRKKIDKNYKYESKNPFYNFFGFLTYNLIAKPITWFCFTFVRGVKYKNKKVLKQAKKSGYFIYANHTDGLSDCLSPAMICNPVKPRVIVNSANLSMPVLGFWLKNWGALPLPDDVAATKNFYSAIEHTLNKNAPIVIYPEAHLWQYYTGIRPFTSLSFRYPVKYNKPVFTFTTTYHKRKFSKKPRLTIYVDGPFYPDVNLPVKEQQQALRDVCFNQMQERAKLNTYEYVKYIKKEKTND